MTKDESGMATARDRAAPPDGTVAEEHGAEGFEGADADAGSDAPPRSAPARADGSGFSSGTGPSEGGNEAAAAAPVTVLVADDDPGIRQVLEFVFAEEGFDVRLAHSAATAREASEEIPAGVVVVDLKLGRDDGLALAHELATRPHLAVVMVSAEPSLAQKAAGTAICPNAVLTKPFPLATLVELVRRKADRLALRQRAGGASPEPAGALSDQAGST